MLWCAPCCADKCALWHWTDTYRGGPHKKQEAELHSAFANIMAPARAAPRYMATSVIHSVNTGDIISAAGSAVGPRPSSGTSTASSPVRPHVALRAPHAPAASAAPSPGRGIKGAGLRKQGLMESAGEQTPDCWAQVPPILTHFLSSCERQSMSIAAANKQASMSPSQDLPTAIRASPAVTRPWAGGGAARRTVYDPAGESGVLAHADRVQPLSAHGPAQAVPNRAAICGRLRLAPHQRRSSVAAEAVARAARQHRRAVSSPAPRHTACESSPAVHRAERPYAAQHHSRWTVQAASQSSSL